MASRSELGARAWPLLTNAAANGNLVAYEELGMALGQPAVGVGKNVLGQLFCYCLVQNLPPLTSIVVGSESEMPGDGFLAYRPDYQTAWSEVFDFDWSPHPSPESAEVEASFKRLKSQGYVDADARWQFPEAPLLSETEGTYTGKYRRLVGSFRDDVIENFGGECAICKLAIPELLDAAHILPWAKHPERRLATENGIALCTLHHRAHDRGILRIKPDGSVRIREDILGADHGPGYELLTRFHGQEIKEPTTFLDLGKAGE